MPLSSAYGLAHLLSSKPLLAIRIKSWLTTRAIFFPNNFLLTTALVCNSIIGLQVTGSNIFTGLNVNIMDIIEI